MTRSTAARFLTGAAAVALIHLPSTAAACSVCMGDPNSKGAVAINNAIFVLLGCIALMLGSLAAFAIYLMKRAG